MDDLMPIGEFSELSGLSPKRLRSYAAAGLLVPAAVDSASGYRYYSPGQARHARLIDALRDAGMPVAEIGALLRNPSIDQLEMWSTRVESEAAGRKRALETARHLLYADPAPSPSELTLIGERTMTTAIQLVGRTAIGRVRENNEDAVVTADGFAVVADGMGGHPGGEVASTVAVELVAAAFTGRSLDELSAGVRAANRAIWGRAQTDPALDGMGTTICAIGITEDAAMAVVSVGDTRAYLLRDGVLAQLTRDHTLTAELVRRGEMTEQEAVDHPQRAVLTRALGVGPDVELDGEVHPVVQGDRLLICTDGLFNEVSRQTMADLLAATPDLTATADALVEHALAGGGRDNISVVIGEVST